MDVRAEGNSPNRLQIDVEDMIMALQNQDREGVFYLDRESGEVKFYYDGLFDGEEVDGGHQNMCRCINRQIDLY
jgi:hypothetical protein